MKTTGELIELLNKEIEANGIGLYTEKRKAIEEMLRMKGINPLSPSGTRSTGKI